MIKDSKNKRKITSLLLAFTLLIGFIPLSQINAEEVVNYAKDEAKIKDFSSEERYRLSQMDPGNSTSHNVFGASTDNMEESIDGFIDGFRHQTLEPDQHSVDKTKWGLEIEFDKEKSQRTYTDFSFTNSGNLGRVLNSGNISANSPGEASFGDGFKAPNYKAESEIVINGVRAQRNLNLSATEADLNHINSKDNKNTIMAWQGHYLKVNINGPFSTRGDNAAFGFSVNPWPNENDKLDIITLNGSHDQREFVQGQTIDTDVEILNLDANAKERVVGQVYHPLTGEVVPGSKAYIDENGKVKIDMPEGAVDENGNINKDSIFYKDPNYKGLQSLDVKFFTRPRTKAEFEAIVEKYLEDYGAYTPTGAGQKTIKHDGEDVEIDLQGIDRYDHYNLIGSFKLNLDDTRYYDQGFIDGNKEDTSKHTSSSVRPGEEFEVKLYVPEDKKDKDAFPNQKIPEEMETAKANNEVVGTINESFINKANEGKSEKDKWKLDYDENSLPSSFKITPPKSAKPGDFVAVPLTYTYTNGSTDVHWFHFVVQDTVTNKPEYLVQVELPSVEQKSTPELPKDENKLSPKSYSIPEGTEFIDDKDNEWTVSINKTTGEITAKPNDPSAFNGGEKLQVPVVAHYEDPERQEAVITEETTAEFVIKEKTNLEPRYNAKAGKAGDVLSSTPIVDEEDEYNRKPSKYSLASNTFTDDKGNVWEVTIDENTGKITATVPEGVELDQLDGALLNVPVIAHYNNKNGEEIGTKEVEAQFIASGTEGIYEKIVETPFETKIEKDPNLKKGEIQVITEGEKGSKKIKYTIKDSKVDEEKTTEEVIKEPRDRLIKVGQGVNDGTHEITETVEIPFETIVEFDDELRPGEKVVETEGEPGEKTRTINLTIEDGKVTKSDIGDYEQTKTPVNRVIKVGRNTEGKIVHEEKIPFKYDISYDKNLKSGEYVIDVEGTEGIRTTTWTIKNSEVVGKPDVKETPAIDAKIRVGQKDFTGSFETKKTSPVEFETEYIVDNSLEPGKAVIEQEGTLGEEEITVTHTIVNGEVTNSEESKPVQTKAPEKRIVKVGPAKTEGTHEYKNKIPFEVEVRVNPKLQKGEYNILQKGEFGEEKYTLTIKNSEVTETSEPVTTKEAKPEIIEIGNEDFTGKVEYIDKDPIPFETEVTIDTNLEPNEIVEDQKGELGEQETKVVRQIKNGEAGEEERGQATQTKAPVTRKLRIGAKTEGEHTYTNKKPYKVEVRVNPKLKKGEYKVVQEGIEGEEEYTITVENSKVINTSPAKETKAPVNEIIEIGGEDFTGTFETKKTKSIEFETEYIVDNSLEPGTTKVEQEGELGEEETTVTHTILNGEVKESKEGETVQTKDPVKKIVKVGPAKTDGTHEYTNKIPFEVEIRVNPKLKKGEHNILQKGEAGEEKYTLTIENSVVTETSAPTIMKQAKPQIIEVGDEDFTGTIEYIDKDPIPFETEVIIDPNLEPNEIVEDQKGELGEQETKITRTITNGEAGKEERGETNITKEPVNRKIRVGSKSSGTHTIEEKVEVPFETIVEFDDSLKPGEQIVSQEGAPGEKTRTTTLTIKNGEVVNTENSEFTETKAPTNKIIKVGRNTEGEVVHVEKLPFKYIINEVDNLKKGEYEIVKPGKEGTKTTTWTIKNSQIEGKPLEEIIEPEDAIIHVGKGVNNGTHEIEEKVEIPFETIVEFDDSLEPGEQVVEVEGSLGEKVRTTTLTIEDGKVTDTQVGVFVQTKDPVNRVVKVGRNTEGEIVHEEKIPFKYEISYDENLKSGEYVIDVEGTEGTRTTTWTIKNSQVVGEPEITETKPVDAVIRVGQKDFTGTLETKKTKAIEFETEYIVDNSSEPGTVEVEQEGSLGEEEITVTHTIVNGEVTNSEESKPVQTKSPVKRIVKVGPGKTDGNLTYESELAYDVIIEEDSELEAGKYEVVQEGVVGKTRTTVNLVNSKEESRDTEIITEKQDKIIKIGTKSTCEKCEVPEQPGQETSEETESETPKETEGETPCETCEETPKETEGETSCETCEETPKETERETPCETCEETPKETEGETSCETCEEIPGKPEDNNPDQTGKETSEKTRNNDSSKTANNAKNPKTGDKGIVFVARIAIISLVFSVIIFIMKKKNKK